MHPNKHRIFIIIPSYLYINQIFFRHFIFQNDSLEIYCQISNISGTKSKT